MASPIHGLKDMVRVAHITTIDLSIRFLLWNQLKYLRGAGLDVSVVCSDGPWVKEIREDGFPVETIEMKRGISPGHDLIALCQLIQFFRKKTFDIVHTHTPKAGLLGQLAAKRARVPIIVNTVHGFYFHDYMNPWMRRFYIYCEKIAAHCSDLIYFQSREDMATAKKEGICEENQMIYLGNGIDLRLFSPSWDSPLMKEKKKALNIDDGGQVIGMVGRLTDEKGYREFFEAAKIVSQTNPQTHFLAIGPSDVVGFEKYQALISQLGLTNRVHVLGMRLDMPELYNVMDLYVLPSYREGFPRSVMEASAMGKPVIATDIRGCREAVDPGETGLLVPIKDPMALAKAILHLLNNPALAQKMGKEGSKKAEREFNERIVFEKVLKGYRTLLAQKEMRRN
jgi:glycosyltransferase involved in cell wall biosynthesis